MLDADAGDKDSDSDFLNQTILSLGAAKQSTQHHREAKVAEKLEAKKANKIMESSDRSLDFVVKIPTTSENAIRLKLCWLWNRRMGHVNSKRLGSLFQYATRLEQVNLPSLEYLNCFKCNFSNMTLIVNKVTLRRKLQWLKKIHTEI